MPEGKVILVTWGGAPSPTLSKLIQTGALPRLARVTRNGASGAARMPLGSAVARWMSAATGAAPHVHKLAGALVNDPSTGSVRKAEPQDLEKDPFWRILSRSAIRTHVLGWPGLSAPEPLNGVFVSQEFSRQPPQTTCATLPATWNKQLSELRVEPQEIDPRLLYLFLPTLGELRAEHDLRWQIIIKRLAELYSIHNAAIALLNADPDSSVFSIHYSLADKLALDLGPVLDSTRKDLSDRERRLYNTVIEASFRTQDFLLNDLLSHAGDDTTLVFVAAPGDKTDAETSSHAFLAISGAGVATGEQISDCSLLDVAPTLLWLHGLPAGPEIGGKALVNLFHRPPTVNQSVTRSVEKRLSVDPSTNRSPSTRPITLGEAQELGYALPKVLPPEGLAHVVHTANTRTVATSMLEHGLPKDALELLWPLYAEAPESPALAYPTLCALADLGLRSDAEQVLQLAEDFGPSNAIALHLKGRFLSRWGKYGDAELLFEKASELAPGSPAIDIDRGFAALRDQRWQEAVEHLRKAHLQETDQGKVCLGIAQAYLQLGELDLAKSAAGKALAYRGGLPAAHLVLAQVYEALGEADAAIVAYCEALKLDPDLQSARDGIVRTQEHASDEAFEKVMATLSRMPGRSLRQDERVGDASEILRRLQANAKADRSAKRATTAPVLAVHYTSHPDGIQLEHERRAQATNHPGFTLRAPWPDELTRVWNFVDLAPAPGYTYRPLVAITGSPERLIGAAILQTNEDPAARIHLGLQPGYRETSITKAFVESMEMVAKLAGKRRMTLVAANNPYWQQDLVSSGFNPLRADEWWLLAHTARFAERVASARRIATRSALAAKFKTGPIEPRDIPSIQAISKSHGLAQLDQLGGADISWFAENYSTALSLVVRYEDEVAGVFLVRALQDRAFVHILAAAPRFMKHSGVINAILVAALDEPPRRQIDRWIFTGRSDHPIERQTIALAKRFGGERLGSYVLYSKDIMPGMGAEKQNCGNDALNRNADRPEG